MAAEPLPTAPPRRRRRDPWLWLALLLLLLLAGGAAAYFLTRPAKVVVPPVVGEQLNTARTVLQNRGFTTINVINAPDTKPAGIVFGENPAAGTKTASSTPITLTVSSGPGSVNVPSVLGDTVAQAKQLLRQAGLKVGATRHQNSNTSSPGTVIDSSPSAGQNVTVGTRVTLIVSSGPAKVTVPDVTGESEAQAKSDLHTAGFEVSATSEASSTVQPGNVISQNPTGNDKAIQGSTVSIVVAKASNTAQVPSVNGQQAAAAQAALQGAGFKVVQQSKAVTRRARNGVVLSQSPGGGSTVKKGSTVTITVGKYTAPTGPTGATTPATPTTPTTTPGSG